MCIARNAGQNLRNALFLQLFFYTGYMLKTKQVILSPTTRIFAFQPMRQETRCPTKKSSRVFQENIRMGAELDISRKRRRMILLKSEELNRIKDLENAEFTRTK